MGAGIREAFAARPGWGFCSIDYGALEMGALAQVCVWKFGFSKIADSINAGEDQHCRLVARMINEPYEKVMARKEANDSAIGLLRFAAKCFHPETQILTRLGWKRIDTVTYDDEIACPDPSNGVNDIRIAWHKPLRLTERKAETLIHLKNEGIDLRVTPDHRMLWFNTKGAAGECSPTELHNKRTWANAGVWHGGSIAQNERLLRLAVATQADGSYKSNGRIDFGFTKARKIERLKALLQAHEYGTHGYQPENPKHNRVMFFSLSLELSRDIRALLTERKTLPWWWLELSLTQRQIVMEEARFWDGSTRKGGVAYEYSSCEIENHDVMQAIASVTGRKSRFALSAKANAKRRACYKTTIRTKGTTRGENLETTTVQHNDSVYCITVPTECVIVRDGGIPVITRQCGNFGFAGGMGPAKFVVSKRQDKSEDFPRGVRFCELLGRQEKGICGTKAGVPYVDRWNKRPCPPVCPVCCECVAEIKEAYLNEWEEMRKFFKWCSEECSNPEGGYLVIPGTDVVRGPLQYPAFCNGNFQGLAAVGAKRAMYAVTKECYAVPTSPLYRVCRPVAFVHDEIISEIWLPNLHEAAMRKQTIMLDEMRRTCPDVKITAEPAAALRLYKSMQPVWTPNKKDPNRRLALWYPKAA